ncbi:AcrR family transcriptional regulator [Actinoplanes tereljensis]|uniref:TetR family transcriptional regulator n=1 Tax=Paractinoplanes tereljensis TaxID=571912 RepID=A0A919P0L9_9ACTN|nr:TetR/AcrR family transcriptional regulator [Actinoplanes tereljensis]GIF26727.1 TetR family transcriptional regulator [Actinoplanes tereljensis]
MDTAPARGRPRDPAVDERIVRAAVEELAGTGAAAFSLNSVALRAGVAKRSIYSRWPNRETLITAALQSLSVGLAPPRTGTLSGDLDALFDQIAETLSEPRQSILARYAAELSAHPEQYAVFQRDVIDQAMAVIEDALVDARRRGEIRGDAPLPLAAEVFVSAIFGRSGYARHTPSGDFPQMKDGLIALTMNALRADGTPAR